MFSLTYFFIFREEIALMSKNFIEWALIFSYGVVSIAKGFYYYSVEYGYFINEGNYKLFKYFLIFLTSFYGLLLFLLKFKFEKNLSKNISLEEKMFLAGGGIFIGTFIVSANVDYRLVFLLLTLPYLSQQLSQKLNIIYFIVLLICFNSLLFSAGNPYGYIFFLKALCVYALKIIIFSLNCYYFGYILNKFIKIKIFNFKIT